MLCSGLHKSHSYFWFFFSPMSSLYVPSFRNHPVVSSYTDIGVKTVLCQHFRTQNQMFLWAAVVRSKEYVINIYSMIIKRDFLKFSFLNSMTFRDEIIWQPTAGSVLIFYFPCHPVNTVSYIILMHEIFQFYY